MRLNMIAAWREATVITDAERAALAVTEDGSRLADGAGGVSDETWEPARKHFEDDQLVALVALINAYIRMNAIPRIPAGDYEPGKCEWCPAIGHRPLMHGPTTRRGLR